MGISLRPTSCWVLHAAAAGAIFRLLCSAALVRLKAALIGSLTRFVAKTRSGGKVFDSYTLARRRASTFAWTWTGKQSACHPELAYRS